MKPRLAPLFAALLLAGAAPLAYSQAAAVAPADVAAPAAYVDSPVASVSRSDAVADAIAQALNADASLKDSKITVQPDENGTVLLTGVTPTNAQRQKALEIATGHAGSGKVANAITSGELVVATTPPVTAASLEAATTEAAAPDAAADSTLATLDDFVAAPEPAQEPARERAPEPAPESAPAAPR